MLHVALTPSNGNAMPALVWLDEKGTPRANFKLSRRITSLGSSPSNDVVLAASGVDESHALLQFDGQSFIYQSLTPTGESRVNGKKVRRETLEHGDELTIGQAQLRFHLFDTTETIPPPQTSDRVESYGRILEFSRALLEEHEPDAILAKLMDAIIELTGAERGFLMMMEDGEPVIRVARSVDQETLDDATALYSDSIVHAAIKARKTLIVSDALKDQTFRSSHSVVNLRLCSVLCAPLLYRGELLGVLYVGNNNVVNLFTEAHAEAVTVFAANAALIVRNAMMLHEVRADNTKLRQTLDQLRFGAIIGASDAMRAVYAQIERVAPTDISVLIGGETGTGKELIAREIHERSTRAKGPFIPINCGAIPESLLESELFGYVRGAFTGAAQARIGKFQAANGGTLFLDEIGEMPLHLQVKILRAIQERVVTRIGDHKDEPIDIRIVAATNRDLAAAIQEGTFREDLYYRLNVITIHLPALRDRGDDVLLIARYLVDRYVREFNTPSRKIGQDAAQALRRYTWPGNIRQLENHVKKAVVLADGPTLTPQDFDLDGQPTRVITPLNEAKERWQTTYIREAVELCAGNRSQAAKELGIDPRTIYRYLQEPSDTATPSAEE